MDGVFYLFVLSAACYGLVDCYVKAVKSTQQSTQQLATPHSRRENRPRV